MKLPKSAPLSRSGLVLVAVLSFAGCAQPVPALTASGPDSEALTFLDADEFDSSLSNALAADPAIVHVAFVGQTSMNHLPARMNAWLEEIQTNDGQVTTIDISKVTRGETHRGVDSGTILDAVDLPIPIRDRIARENRLARVKDYDASIVFDGRTGQTREIVFTRRAG